MTTKTLPDLVVSIGTKSLDELARGAIRDEQRAKTLAGEQGEFVMPLADLVTSRYDIIGISGCGKTILSRRIAEELCRLKQPWIALDVVGNWWGLKSGADGKSEGFPVVVIGGRHADLPLDPKRGARVAQAVVGANVFAVIDLSGIDKDDRWIFTKDFVDELIRLQPETPRHVFFEEAKELANQQPENGNASRCKAAIDSFCTLGRNYGYGYTAIGQRPAKISKDVLTQAGALFVMRLQGTQDLDAVGDWVNTNGPELDADTFRKAVARLGDGEAYFVDPKADPPLVRVKVRRGQTLHPPEIRKFDPGMLKRAVLADVGKFVQGLQNELTKPQAPAPKTSIAWTKESPPQEEDAPSPPGTPKGRSFSPERQKLENYDHLEHQLHQVREELGRQKEQTLQWQGRAIAAENKLGAVRKLLTPQYDALCEVFSAGDFSAVPTVAESDPAVPRPAGALEDWTPWLERAGKGGKRKMLEALVKYGPMTAKEWAARAGMVYNTGGFRNCQTWFLRNKLLERDGKLIALVGTRR